VVAPLSFQASSGSREPGSEGEELEPLGERPTSLTAVSTVEYIEDAYPHAATPGCVPGPRF
jgi:hypothetical protein